MLALFWTLAPVIGWSTYDYEVEKWFFFIWLKSRLSSQ